MGKYSESIEIARQHLGKIDDPAHDVDHAAEVVDNGMRIAIAQAYDDVEFIELCCWWHDVARGHSNHEELGAQKLRDDLLQRGAEPETAHKAYEAIRFHRWAMQPRTVEGKILKDADKLTFISKSRWGKCIAVGRLEHMTPILPLLPKLEGSLYFAFSQALYGERISGFLTYLKSAGYEAGPVAERM